MMTDRKKMRYARFFSAALAAAMLCGCSGGNEGVSSGGADTEAENTPAEITGQAAPLIERVPLSTEPVTSDTLYVGRVDGISDDFIMGMDASAVISLENSGVSYYNFKGEEEDVFRVLAENGVNYIRVRVWNDPFDADGNGYGGGNCDINNALEIGKRATKYGMRLLVDFHYSDFWADPSKQMVPKAWEGMEIEEKTEALHKYTLESLTLLKDAGVDVGMVQVGNETNGWLCGEKIWMNIYYLMDAGSRAVREVYPEALVAVHFANPESAGSYENYAKKLDYYKLDYDVFASSYYPYWHGTFDNLSNVLSGISEKYGKKVMVIETSYANTPEDTDFFGNTISDGGAIVKSNPFTVQGQANFLRELIDTVANRTKGGIGVCYWEGTWISVGTSSYEENFALWEKYGSGWASSYAASYDPKDAGQYYGGCAVDNQAFFDPSGRPYESLKTFALVKTGNTVELVPDAIEDQTLYIDLNDEIKLPETVNAVMNDNSKQQVPVEWKNVDEDAMHSGGVQTYDIVGTAGGMEAHCYVSMIEYNYLENFSFEDGDMTGWVLDDIGGADEVYVEEKLTDSLTGNWHFHFWSAAQDSVEFTLEQIPQGLSGGKYKFTISIMGGDGGDQNIYSYAKVNGEIVGTAELGITGYNDWHTGVINGIEYSEGDELTVGIYVKCRGEGNGAWGKIDDALLNSEA